MQRSLDGESSPFREKPLAYVVGKIDKEVGGVRIVQEDSDLLIFFKLIKAGYGDFETVKRMDAEEVIQALYYENFLADYQNAMIEKARNN